MFRGDRAARASAIVCGCEGLYVADLFRGKFWKSTTCMWVSHVFLGIREARRESVLGFVVVEVVVVIVRHLGGWKRMLDVAATDATAAGLRA